MTSQEIQQKSAAIYQVLGELYVRQKQTSQQIDYYEAQLVALSKIVPDPQETPNEK